MAEGGDAAAEEWLWLLGAGSAGLQRHPASRAAPPARPGRASWAGANGRPGERTRSPTASGAESCAGPQRCLTGTGPHGNRNTRPGATNQEPGTWEPRDRNNGAGTEASGTVLLRNSMMSDWDRTIREQEPPIRSHKSGTWEPRDRNTGAGTEVSGTAACVSRITGSFPSQKLVKIKRRKKRTRDEMFSELMLSFHTDRAKTNARGRQCQSAGKHKMTGRRGGGLKRGLKLKGGGSMMRGGRIQS
ncbi:uncharacterized protein LOC125643174 isoform X2 [Caretta caretta]|uniref:uncharacterized protein LOC125643174 isoform X2 n=1 Tax=Caretta caretta TaxID=8467 RepID=UPI003F4BCE13